MNELTQKLTMDYVPQLAIIVYSDGKHEYYLESHHINKDGALLEGKPLRDETIRGMVNIFAERAKEEGKIGGDVPPHLLHYSADSSGDYSLSWHRPAEQRTLWFQQGLHIPSGPAMVPPMLYKATKNSLHVWALGSGKRPTKEAERFQAPFHNVNEEGSVCLGSAKVKVPSHKTFEGMITYWEAMFWNSEFSHIAGSSPIKKGENLNLLWKEQVENPKRPFPLGVLKSLSKPKKSGTR